MPSQPLIVSLFGGPGTGKSTTASLVFGELKLRGYNAELVHEYAKDLTWEKAWGKLAYQPYVAAKQNWRLERLGDQVEVVVTDTATILGLIYGKEKGGMTPAFADYLVDDYKRRNTLNIFLERDTSRPYNPSGRRQSQQSAEAKDFEIISMLREQEIPFELVHIDVETRSHLPTIMKLVEARLRPEEDPQDSKDSLREKLAGLESTIAKLRRPVEARAERWFSTPLLSDEEEFYSVKHRKKVRVPRAAVAKKTYERETSEGTQIRYALQVETTVDGDPVKLTKFVGKDDFDRI